MRIVFVNGLTNGLVDVGHFNGQHVPLIYLQWTFSCWLFLKDMVYKEKPRTIPDIRRGIADKIATIDMELCQKVCRSVAARLVF